MLMAMLERIALALAIIVALGWIGRELPPLLPAQAELIGRVERL